MTAFRHRLLLAALLTFAGAAAAQDQTPPVATGAPAPLGEVSAPPADRSSSDQPPATDQAPVEYRPGMLNTPAQSAVTQDALSGIVDGPPVGTLDDSNGGLGQSMWVNAPRDVIEDLLGRIPFVSADPFARGLARRVLLTTSESPIGGAKRALVTIRIEKLLQGGLIEEAGAIAASLHLDNDPDFARVQADALLYAGREQDVCGDLTSARLSLPDPFWLELRAYCFAVSGDKDSADLTRGVMDAQGIKDPAFDILSNDVLTGAKKPVVNIDRSTALHIYLLRKAGFAVSNAAAAMLGTAANLMAARDARNPPDDRLSAAARIAATGALSHAELVAIMNAQTIPGDQLAQAQATAANLTYLPAQSLLHRAASLETRPQAKMDLLLAAVALGRPERLPQTAALQADIVAALKPGPDMLKGRAPIARALLLNGKFDSAEEWYAGAPDGEDLHAFQILLDIAAPNGARDAAAQSAYAWFAANAAPQANPDALAALALGLADALGKPLPPPVAGLAATLEGMRWPGTRPDDDAVRKLEQAASQPGRKGELVLRVLDIVGANGPRDLPADIAIECVRVLMQAGLGSEARTLAIEALALQVP